MLYLNSTFRNRDRKKKQNYGEKKRGKKGRKNEILRKREWGKR